MKLLDYINKLSEEEQNQYAEKAGTTGSYLRAHIKHARKIARPSLIEGLAAASNGDVSQSEVVEHFYASKKTA